MTDKELDEAIVAVEKYRNSGCEDVAQLADYEVRHGLYPHQAIEQAARELQALRRGEHPDLVLMPVKIVDMLWREADEYHIDQEDGLCAVIPMYKYNLFSDWYDEFKENCMNATRMEAVE